MWSNPKHHSALKTRGSQPAHISVLYVSDASVYYFEAMSGRTRREIFTFDQRGVEPTQSGFACSGSARRAAPDNEDIEQFVT